MHHRTVYCTCVVLLVCALFGSCTLGHPPQPHSHPHPPSPVDSPAGSVVPTPTIRRTRIRHDNVRLDPISDCALKSLAWEYAQQVHPSATVRSAVFDGLELGSECDMEKVKKEEDVEYSKFFKTQPKWKRRRKERRETKKEQEGERIKIFVDAKAGEGIVIHGVHGATEHERGYTILIHFICMTVVRCSPSLRFEV